MALNIPNQMAPGWGPILSGFNAGTDFYNKIVNQQNMRSQMQARKAEQDRLNQMLPYQIKHILSQISNAGNMSSMQQQARQEAHQRYLNELDPNYEINRFKQVMASLSGLYGGQPQEEMNARQQLSPNASDMNGSEMANANNMPMPEQNANNNDYSALGTKLSEMSNGPDQSGVLPDIVPNEAEQAAIENGSMEPVATKENPRVFPKPKQEVPNPGLFNAKQIEKMRNDPYARAILGGNPMFKALFAQTPQEKEQEQYNQFVKKEEYKQAHPTAGKSHLTPEQQQKKIELEELRLKSQIKHYDNMAKNAQNPEEREIIKADQAIRVAEAKENIKKQHEEFKEKQSTKKDIPHLEKSLKAIKELKEIVENPKNKDLWGHNWAPERFAKTTHNKEAGKFQSLLSDAIAATESKLSSRGNILALKIAVGLKPSFSETRESNLGKLEGMQKQIEEAIKDSYKLSGAERPKENEHLEEVASKEATSKELTYNPKTGRLE